MPRGIFPEVYLKEKMEKITYYLSALADIALPRCCIVCGRQLGTRENHLCLYCAADFPFTRFWSSSRNDMADRLNLSISRDMESHPENAGYEKYSYAVALFFYYGEAPYKKIPQGLKYRKQFGEGRYFAGLLAEKAFSCRWFSDVDMIIPVPLHWKRKWDRGYNQAEVIAAELAAEKRCRMQADLLCRGKYTLTQTRLSVEDKKRNVNSAFHVRENVADRYSPEHIMLVDDVFTTGATMTACHHALRGFYGRDIRISAAALGFVSSD